MRLPTSTTKSLEGEGPNTPLQPFTRGSLTLQNFYKEKKGGEHLSN
ncbi:unnamed protein product [Musa textilis]